MLRLCLKAIILTIVLPCSSLTDGMAAAGDITDLFKVAHEMLGAKDKTILTSGALRLVLWKSDFTQELMLMPITGLHNTPENFISSFLAYSFSDKGIYSTKIFQCSWREVSRTVVYECGESLKFPIGIRGLPPDQLLTDLKNAMRVAANLNLKMP